MYLRSFAENNVLPRSHTGTWERNKMLMSPLLQQLIDALKCLPGVGPKSAQRMAFYLLERDPQGAKDLSSALTEAVEKIGHCSMCRTLSETELCEDRKSVV